MHNVDNSSRPSLSETIEKKIVNGKKQTQELELLINKTDNPELKRYLEALKKTSECVDTFDKVVLSKIEPKNTGIYSKIIKGIKSFIKKI